MKNNNGNYSQQTNNSVDLNASLNIGQSAQQLSQQAQAAINIHVPQHVLPPQLMAPLFPAGSMLGNAANSIVSGDLYSQINLANARNAGSLPTPDAYQQMVVPPTMPGPESYGTSRRDKGNSGASVTDFGSSDRAKQNRDRNREHARSTRLRKKAYVAKLKDLVEGLHSQRTEDMRQRRVAIQHLSEVQSVRRNVVRTFLNHFSTYERDDRKWATLMEDSFWLKEPVTPYRSFRRAEIEKDCHISKGLSSIMCNSASLAVMVESIGSRGSRWMQLKRQEVIIAEEAQRGSKQKPPCLIKQPSRLQHAISSLSSSSEILSGEDCTSVSDEKVELVSATQDDKTFTTQEGLQDEAAKVSCSSESSNEDSDKKEDASNVYHDYNAKPLPDPKLDEEEKRSSSGDGSADDYVKQGDNSADSYSGDEAGADATEDGPLAKRQKVDSDAHSSASNSCDVAATQKALGPSIAKRGGIPHNIVPVMTKVSSTGSTSSRLEKAPAVVLPPFTGLGKRSGGGSMKQMKRSGSDMTASNSNGTVTSNADAESSLSSESNKLPRTSARFHINEDDMIMMDSVLMCPFVMRSSDAVLCGALAECVMPGMLRAHFSPRNKLLSLELVYDSMGFMQQLERANGNEGAAQIVPGSLEMALTPSSAEARVITLAKSPFLIVNVNDLWTQTTGYTQMEVEGKPYLSLLDGEATLKPACDKSGKPLYDLEEVAKGRSACIANIHYDKHGKDYIEYVCSYPLTNSNDETTHLLHVSKELPSEHGGSNALITR
ncbi:hypothetical protein MPSEU_000647500 [Mayamaea pseudoterrestris]|nr:hypothetical protein MPSEU_000647500 [Mayamaea pseudoterrestris]